MKISIFPYLVPLLLVIMTFFVSCSSASSSDETEESSQDTIVELDSAETESFTIEIKDESYWYGDYDPVQKQNLIVKGTQIESTSNSIDSLISSLNDRGYETQISNYHLSNDTLYIVLEKEFEITQQYGTHGAWEWAAETTFTLSEHEKVNYVYMAFEEGDHLAPGTYTRSMFNEYQIIQETPSALLSSTNVDDQELFNTLRIKDSLLFEIGFNQIDTSIVASLLSADFEFYHDLHGMTDGKSEFIQSIASLSDLPFKTWRILNAESLHIFPLYNNGTLYGVLQEGTHDFYQLYQGESEYKSSTAKFNHLWLIENNQWRLKRVISYDHIEF